MRAPIKGMTTQPAGDEEMAGLFILFVHNKSDDLSVWDEFYKLHPKYCSTKSYDDDAVVAAFADFVTKNIWGEDKTSK